MNEAQADQILNLVSFGFDQGVFSYDTDLLNFLRMITESYPNLLVKYKYVYVAIADAFWFVNLPSQRRCLPSKERLLRPKSWWTPDTQIFGLPRQRKNNEV